MRITAQMSKNDLGKFDKFVATNVTLMYLCYPNNRVNVPARGMHANWKKYVPTDDLNVPVMLVSTSSLL